MKAHGGYQWVLNEMHSLHVSKGDDYGVEADPLWSVRASEEFGVPAWKACLMRANEKMTRLKAYCRNGSLTHEGVEDTMLDAANYLAMALALWRESSCDDSMSSD